MSGKGKKIWKLLWKIAGALLSAGLLVIAAVSLILARPEEKPPQPAPAQAETGASPALEVHSEEDLYRLVQDFPAPVMSFMSGSGMTFVSALSSDAAAGSRFARVATIWWQTADGVPVTLQSIYPADALSLLEEGFHFSAEAGPAVFGSPTVRMEKDQVIRIHTATDEALYVILVPFSLSDQIQELSRSVQLFTVHSEE